MQTVVETLNFIRRAKRLGLTDEELDIIKVMVAEQPSAGNVIPGTGGARKIRIPLRGQGKRGGYRVITFYSGKDIPIFLLDIYAKSDKADLTRREIKSIHVNATLILRHYRE